MISRGGIVVQGASKCLARASHGRTAAAAGTRWICHKHIEMWAQTVFSRARIVVASRLWRWRERPTAAVTDAREID
jgi:hypothetical protein